MGTHDQFINEANNLNPEITRYSTCIGDVKSRWWHIQNTIKKGPITYSICEYLCLEFRMITENILLANLASHEGYYYKTLHDLAGMWNAKDIISTIKKINPDYYPVPIRMVKMIIPHKLEAAGEIYFDPAALVESDLLKIHSQCSEYLHPQNPFAKEKDYQIYLNFSIWLERIKELLKSHSVRLVGNDNRRLFITIDFESPAGTDGDIIVGYMKQNIESQTGSSK